MRMKSNNEAFSLTVATVSVVRATNPGITELGDLASVAAETAQE
jgi:hypothetical protein